MSKHQRLPIIVGSASLALLFLLLWLGLLQVETAVSQPAANLDKFGYGFNVAAWDVARLQNMGFNWIKVFNGPGSRLPVNVLMRVPADAGHLADLNDFAADISQLAQEQKGYIDAYEIGNEPNLDASYGWNAAPVAADYVTLLCTAYERIKTADPQAVVVSAGLAPTGRVGEDWKGHAGHNGRYQDEREFLREFIAAGGGECADAIGYHPYGYSADYDAVPDQYSADDTQNCSNGFCFRGAEKIYELMQANGLGQMPVWATEFGWIVEPPAECLEDDSWNGRSWQIVTEEKQADNLVGAFTYAVENWPWMEAMFVFNLNFNQAGYAACEQMRYYAVQGRPSESALADMPKEVLRGELIVSPKKVVHIIAAADQPFARSVPVQIHNSGTAVFTYTTLIDSGSLTPTVPLATGVLSPEQNDWLTMTLSSDGRAVGTYTATLMITATGDVDGAPATLPVTLYVVDELHPVFLPAISRP